MGVRPAIAGLSSSPRDFIAKTFMEAEVTVYEPTQPFQLDAEGMMEKTAEALGIKTDMGRKAFRAFCEAAVLLDSKQRDYGSGNISAFGEKGVIVRMNDKVERLKTLVWKDKSPEHEKVSDTWLDITNYGIIGLLCHRKEWK